MWEKVEQVIKQNPLSRLFFPYSMTLFLIVNLFVLVNINWSSEQDYFDGLEILSDSRSDSDQKNFHILEDFRFKPFSDDLPSEYQVFGYESYFKGVRPDIGVRIGRDTVQKWSHRLLKESNSPVRYVRYEILQDYLDVVVTVDYDYFVNQSNLRLLSPAWAPGEVFKDINKRRSYDESTDSNESFVFDVRFRLRFPLVGYQNPDNPGSLNTVFMEFSKQAVQTYYLKDFETYLKLASDRIRSIEQKSSLRVNEIYGANLNPEAKLDKANAEIEKLMAILKRRGSLSRSELDRLKRIQSFLNGEDQVQNIDESMRDGLRQIENFKASSLLPIVPSAAAVKRLLQEATRQKIFAEYLVMEVISYDNQAGGVLKVSGLNRVIEPNLPQVDIYFVGIDQISDSTAQYFGEEKSKLFIAARMR